MWNHLDTHAEFFGLEISMIIGVVFGMMSASGKRPLDEKSPLWGMEKVLITPHISWCSFGHSVRMEKLITEICAENLRRYISGKPLKNVVSQK